jgi:ribosomal protein S18 acetylase RimI-like enzyme
VFTEQSAIRPYADEDRDRVLALDTSFLSDSIFLVSRDGEAFLIALEPQESPRPKTFDLGDDLAEAAWDEALVAEGSAGVVAVCAMRFESWHGRQAVLGLYVDAGWRRRGLGRSLLAGVRSRGVENGANHMWLETTNANVPAVRAYERMGFVVCGLDVSFYRGTTGEGEVGLFMSQDIPGR